MNRAASRSALADARRSPDRIAFSQRFRWETRTWARAGWPSRRGAAAAGRGGCAPAASGRREGVDQVPEGRQADHQDIHGRRLPRMSRASARTASTVTAVMQR